MYAYLFTMLLVVFLVLELDITVGHVFIVMLYDEKNKTNDLSTLPVGGLSRLAYSLVYLWIRRTDSYCR